MTTQINHIADSSTLMRLFEAFIEAGFWFKITQTSPDTWDFSFNRNKADVELFYSITAPHMLSD